MTVQIMGIRSVTSYIEGNSIVINSFGQMTSKVYPLKDISKIKRSKQIRGTNGKMMKHREYRVYFSDGFVWTVDELGTNYVEFMEALSQKAGIHIVDGENGVDGFDGVDDL